MIPEEVHQQVEESVGKEIASASRVSGGSINEAAKVVVRGGQLCFLKWNRQEGATMFAAEERGLELLRSASHSMIVPAVLLTGESQTGTGFLLQEFIESGQPTPASASNFARAVAAMHKHRQSRFGLDHDNYIGRLPQSNAPHENWTDFFINERLQPQLKLATDSGTLGADVGTHFESMYRRLPEIFPDEAPALLHGDLWSGNFFYDKAGQAVIYDPAVYYGHREIELAFTHLFGGFPPAFYRAYESEYPLAPRFPERKDLYNLYPLLVHTNLFGGSYARQVKAIVNRF